MQNACKMKILMPPTNESVKEMRESMQEFCMEHGTVYRPLRLQSLITRLSVEFARSPEGTKLNFLYCHNCSIKVCE